MLLSLKDVSIVRDGRAILESLSIDIAEGQHTAILGPNGCGKSTLIKSLTREIHPFAGRGVVQICGRERWVQSDLRKLIGVVSGEPKEPLLGSPTGLEVAVSGLLGTYGVLVQYDVTPEMFEQGRAALARVDGLHLADQPVETMSTGEHRRCFIARALINHPKGLVLDEPTTGLDIKASQLFMETVRKLAQEGTTIILVTHHLDEVIPEIGRVVMLKSGRVFADGRTEELLNPGRVAELFDADLATAEHALSGFVKLRIGLSY